MQPKITKFISRGVPLGAGVEFSAFKTRFQFTFLPVILIQDARVKWELESRGHTEIAWSRTFPVKMRNHRPGKERWLGCPHHPPGELALRSQSADCLQTLVSSQHCSAVSTMGPSACILCCIESTHETVLSKWEGDVCFYCKTCLSDALHSGCRKKINTMKLQHFRQNFRNHLTSPL